MNKILVLLLDNGDEYRVSMYPCSMGQVLQKNKRKYNLPKIKNRVYRFHFKADKEMPYDWDIIEIEDLSNPRKIKNASVLIDPDPRMDELEELEHKVRKAFFTSPTKREKIQIIKAKFLK